MKIRTAPALLCLAVSAARLPCSAQGIVWSRLAGSREWDQGRAVAVDGNGDAYVAGQAAAGIDDQDFAGVSDVCLVKFDRSGKKIWTRMFGTPDYEFAYDIAVDSAGSIYVLGTTRGALDGNPHSGEEDVFLAKFDGTGKKLWTRTGGTRQNDYPAGLAIGTGGMIYIAASSQGNWDGKPGAGSSGAVLVKYSPNGDRLWCRTAGTSDAEMIADIAIDSRDNLYLAGRASPLKSGEPNGREYALVMKFDREGALQWTRAYKDRRTPGHFKAIHVDDRGNLYLAGGTGLASIGDTVVTETYRAFLMKYDPDGKVLWGRVAGAGAQAKALAADPKGDLYIAGEFEYSMDEARPAGQRDFFLAKYGADGTKHWSRAWGTRFQEWMNRIAIDKDGMLFLAGETEGWLGGNRNAGNADISLTLFSPQSPSFDCAEAGTLQENLICRDPVLSGLDASIARLYKARLKSSPKPAETKARQAEWLKSKRNAARTREELLPCLRERADALKAESNGGKP